jgi:hypothetical protein
LRLPVGTKGDDPGMFITVGERVSAMYCGMFCSRPMEYRGAEDDEGYRGWCLLVRPEWLDTDEVVDILLDAPRRCALPGMLLTPDMRFVRPWRLPISVEVRSIDVTPGPADEKRSDLGAPWGFLPDVRLIADILEARDVRPPPFGSRSDSIMLIPPTRVLPWGSKRS